MSYLLRRRRTHFIQSCVDRVDAYLWQHQALSCRIVNQYNDNHDTYVKKDALGSMDWNPNNYSPQTKSIFSGRGYPIAEHIIGVPGDDFIRDFLKREELNEVRLAKEFIKFNERCLFDCWEICGHTIMWWK